MNRQTLTALLVILVILVALAGIALTGGQTKSSSALLFPDLKAEINAINEVVVTVPADHPDDKAASGRIIATLERGADRWTVQERDGYPADLGKLRKLLLGLAEARVIEQKTSDPAYYPRLGVQDMTVAGGPGVALALHGAKRPIQLIVGLAGPDSESTYVRRAGEAASWLIAGPVAPGKETSAWLDPLLTNIPASRIASVSITHPDGDTLRITQQPPASGTAAADASHVEFDVAGIPKGRSLGYPGIANGIAGALAELQLEDVQKQDSSADTAAKPVVARFVTTDGLAVEVSAWRLPGGTRYTFNAATADIAAGDSAALDAAAKEATALNARLGGWLYALPDYKAEQFTKSLKDLLAPR